MEKVIGMAIAQKRTWVLFWERMSLVFMPRKLVTNDRGKNTMVMIVKTSIALPLFSCFTSTSCTV